MYVFLIIPVPLLITDTIHTSENQRKLTTGQSSDYLWVSYDCVRALRNLTICGRENGKMVVHEATTEELRQILPDVVDTVNKVLGEVAALHVRTWIG